MPNDPSQHERDRYLSELLDSTLKTVERVIRRMDQEAREDRETLNHLLHELRKIEHDLHPPTPPPAQPQLTTIKIQFSKGTPMPTPGPVTLTTAGQQVTASVLGFDQNGQPFTGTMPPATLSSDDTAQAIVTFDPATGLTTAVANGVANITANLTTAEGLALTDTEAVTVAIPVVPLPTPVLSSIKVAFQ